MFSKTYVSVVFQIDFTQCYLLSPLCSLFWRQRSLMWGQRVHFFIYVPGSTSDAVKHSSNYLWWNLLTSRLTGFLTHRFSWSLARPNGTVWIIHEFWLLKLGLTSFHCHLQSSGVWRAVSTSELWCSVRVPISIFYVECWQYSELWPQWTLIIWQKMFILSEVRNVQTSEEKEVTGTYWIEAPELLTPETFVAMPSNVIAPFKVKK